MGKNDILNRVFEAIDKKAKEYLDFTTEMVRIPSVNPPGVYGEISRCVHDKFQSIGLESKVITTPEESVSQKGLLHPRHSVIGRLPGSSSKRKGILCVHLDTVPVDNERLWKHPPFSGEQSEGKIWGRGACDCKGRLSSFALALDAIQTTGTPLGGDVLLAATADEEIGGELGAGYLASLGLLDGEFCIIEGFLNEMLYGYAGVLHMKFITRGRAAHTAQPWRGVNAIQRMQRVMEAIGRVQEILAKKPSRFEEMRYSTLNIGVIRGGAKASIVPDYCEMEFDGRLIPEDRPEFVVGLIQGQIERLRETDPGFDIEREVIRQSAAYRSDSQSPLVGAIQESLRLVGYSPTPIPVTMSRGGSDMKYFIPRGIPSVAFGAGRRPDSNIHGADENLCVDDFIQATKASAATLIQLLRDK